jgi:hypothetical protein
MNKSLYICGDSFCCLDPEYAKNWPELLLSKVNNINVVNLASPAASNYLIYLQVKHALDQKCDYIIYNATSSIRHEFILNKNMDSTDNMLRYWDLSNPDNNKSMISMSWLNPQNTASQVLNKKIIKQHAEYFTNYIDLPSMIEKNFIFINYTLELLNKSNVIWAWNRGGFEHKNFKSTQHYNFSNWHEKESKINMWDYYDSSVIRPYYHVTNKQILQDVCNEYINMLNLDNA